MGIFKGGTGSGSGSFHSRAFHDYFEGYIETTVTDPATGRQTIKRIYADPYYSKDLPASMYIPEKALYMLCYIVSVILYEFSTTLGSSYGAIYIKIPVIISTLCYFYLLYVNIICLFTPRLMTTGQYHASSRTLLAALRLSFLPVGASVIAELIYILIPGNPEKLYAFLSMAGFAASWLVCFFIYRREERSVYVQVPNENSSKAGSRINA